MLIRVLVPTWEQINIRTLVVVQAKGPGRIQIRIWMRTSIRVGIRGHISILVPQPTPKPGARVLIPTPCPTPLSSQAVKVSTAMRTRPEVSRTETDTVIPTRMAVSAVLSHPAAVMINMVPGGARTNMETNNSFLQYPHTGQEKLWLATTPP